MWYERLKQFLHVWLWTTLPWNRYLSPWGRCRWGPRYRQSWSVEWYHRADPAVSGIVHAICRELSLKYAKHELPRVAIVSAVLWRSPLRKGNDLQRLSKIASTGSTALRYLGRRQSR